MFPFSLATPQEKHYNHREPIFPLIDSNIFQNGETNLLEFKERLPEKGEKYLKTIIAFANGKGGQLIFGIRDTDRAVVGIPREGIFRMMDSIAQNIANGCEPSIIPDISIKNIEDKSILIITIQPGKQKPYHLKSIGPMKGTYIRVAGTTQHADDALIHEMYYEDSMRSYDRTPDLHTRLDDDEVAHLCSKMTEVAKNNSKSDEERSRIRNVTADVLSTWGIISEHENTLYPSHAFSILLGKNSHITKIQCALFDGTTRATFLDKRDCLGFLPSQIDEAVQFVLRHIRRGCTFEGIYRKDIYELPPDSIREIIVNAALHRSYLQPSSIQVAVYDDRVEITSPGRWVPGMSEKNIREGYSRVRNHALAEAFDYMGVCEKWGSGLSRVFQEMQNRGLPEPEFIETELYLRVNLYRRITDTSQIEPAIIRELSLHPQLTQNQLAERIGVSVQAVKRVFAQMRKKGIISRTGNNRSGEWLIHPNTH